MAPRLFWSPVAWLLASFLLLVLVACGAPAATATPAPAADPTPAPAAGETPPATPLAQATPTPGAPAAVTTPSGTLNVGQQELGRFGGHPRLLLGPNQNTLGAIPIGEGLITADADSNIIGMLAESWSISEDFTTWTFNLRQGVQFHKGYGEMTSEDVLWSMQEWSYNDTHPRTSDIRIIWENPEGRSETPDDYTVVVNTGKPIADFQVMVLLMAPGGSATFVTSKRQADEIGGEAANLDIAATGPWAIEEHRTAQFWRMRAVRDHWRQTPYFDELVFWEIPEESARLAGYQTGQLDTFVMSLDNMAITESVPGTTFTRVTDSDIMTLRGPHGQFYVGVGTDAQAPAYDPDLPWVSPNPDINSPEWERAAKVRRALSMAIDRETLVETLVRGLGRADSPIAYYVGYEHLLEGRQWEYNPERARELLAEAGYADGFSIVMSPGRFSLDILTCEAVATMLQDIGIRPRLERVPYDTSLRPRIVSRNFQGYHCQALPNRPLPPANGLTVLLNRSTFTFGAEHPWLEERIERVAVAVDPVEREQLEREIGIFLFDNALTLIGAFVYDAVWPAGPRIQEWSEHVKKTDVRLINGYEYIRPR